jgi:hypothetical protein
VSACAPEGASALSFVPEMTSKARWRRANRRCAHDHQRITSEEFAVATVGRLIESTRPGLAGCCVGADDEPELVGLLVANLQEQIRAEAC